MNFDVIIIGGGPGGIQQALENLFIERMDGNEEIFVRLMNDEAFRNVAASHLMRAVYQQIQTSGKNGG